MYADVKFLEWNWFKDFSQGTVFSYRSLDTFLPPHLRNPESYNVFNISIHFSNQFSISLAPNTDFTYWRKSNRCCVNKTLTWGISHGWWLTTNPLLINTKKPNKNHTFLYLIFEECYSIDLWFKIKINSLKDLVS